MREIVKHKQSEEQLRLAGQVRDFLNEVPIIIILTTGLLGAIAGFGLGVGDATLYMIEGTAASGVVIHCLTRIRINRVRREK